MLFNSLEFLFLYLPVLLVVFFVLAWRSQQFSLRSKQVVHGVPP
jgi:hypothetical protein